MPDNPLDYASVPPRQREGFKVTRKMILFPLFVLGLPVLIVVTRLPQMGRPRETANVVKCGNNMRQFGLQLRLHAERNSGFLPLSLASVIDDPAAAWPAYCFVCPSSGKTPPTSAPKQPLSVALQRSGSLGYVYVAGGLSLSQLTPDVVIAYEPLSNHAGRGMNVLFGDFRVEFCSYPSNSGSPWIDDLLHQATNGTKPIVPSTQSH